jgi:hypothetical protein
MLRSSSLLAVVMAALGSTACAPSVADGARQVFFTSQICTDENTTVKARSDLEPKSVLKGVTPPAGVDLDSVGTTYEITGCNKKVIMVCGRPYVGNKGDPFSANPVQDKERVDKDFADPEFNTDLYTFTRAISIDGNRVSTGVVCQTGSVAQQ